VVPGGLGCAAVSRGVDRRGAFSWVNLLKLIALALVPWLWYRVLPVAPVVDIGFLALVVAVKLSGVLEPIYLTTYKGLEIAAWATSRWLRSP